MVHQGQRTFAAWFWSAMYSATGFTPDVVEQIKGGVHKAYEIPVRRLDEMAWADQVKVRELIEHISEHLAVLKEWNEEKSRMQDSKVKYQDYLTRKKHQLLLDRVKATRPSFTFLYGFFEELSCQKCGLESLDAALLQFHNLKQLSLTGNKLLMLNYLPDNLEVVSACFNRINEVADLSANQRLQHIGLAFNQLADLTNLVPHRVRPISPGLADADSALPQLTTPPPASPSSKPYLPGLLSLDVGFNNLCDLVSTVEDLATLPSLASLVMQGNPLALVPHYRKYVLHWLPQIETLDDIPVTMDERNAVDALPLEALDPTLPGYNEVRVTLTIEDIKGMNADPDRAFQTAEADSNRGKKPKEAAKKKEAAKEKSSQGNRGQGKKGDEDLVAEAAIAHHTSVYIECQFAGEQYVSPECPKHAPVVPAEGAAVEPLPPLVLGHSQSWTFVPSVELRDALMRPLTFHVWEIFTTITPPDPSIPEAQPVVETERRRLGQCDISFADLLFQREERVQRACKMQGNEFIRIDRQRELKRKKLLDDEDRRQKELQAKAEAKEEPSTPVTSTSTKKGQGKLPAAKAKAQEKKPEYEAVSDARPVVIDRYYDPCELDIYISVALELNPKPLELELPEEPQEMAIVQGKGKGGPKKGPAKKK